MKSNKKYPSKRILMSILCSAVILTNAVYANESSFVTNENQTPKKLSFFKFQKSEQNTEEKINKLYEKYNNKISEYNYSGALRTLNKIEKTANNQNTNNEELKRLYFEKYNYNMAIYNIEEAEKNLKLYYNLISSNGNNDDKLRYYNGMLSIYNQQEDYENTLKTLKGIEKIKNQPIFERMDLYLQFANLYTKSGEFNLAEKYLKQYYNESVKELGRNNEYLNNYYLTKINLAMQKGNFKAIPQYYKNINALKKAEGKDVQAEIEFRINNTMLRYYSEISDADNMRKLLKRSSDLLKELPPSYSLLYNNFQIQYYQTINRYDIANYYYKKNYQGYKKENNDDILQYISLNSELARSYKDIQEYEKSIKKVKAEFKALDKLNSSVYGTLYGSAYKDASECYRDMSNIDKAILYANKSLEEIKRFPYDRFTYLDYLYNLAQLQTKEQKNNEAIDNFNYIVKEYKKYGVETQSTINAYKDLAYTYANINEKNSAINTINKAIKMSENIYGRNHIKTYSLKRDKINILNTIGNEKSARELRNSIIEIYLNNGIKGYDVNFLTGINVEIADKNKEEGNILVAKKYAERAKYYATNKNAQSYLDKYLKDIKKEIKDIEKTL